MTATSPSSQMRLVCSFSTLLSVVTSQMLVVTNELKCTLLLLLNKVYVVESSLAFFTYVVSSSIYEDLHSQQ